MCHVGRGAVLAPVVKLSNVMFEYVSTACLPMPAECWNVMPTRAVHCTSHTPGRERCLPDVTTSARHAVHPNIGDVTVAISSHIVHQVAVGLQVDVVRICKNLWN